MVGGEDFVDGDSGKWREDRERWKDIWEDLTD